jgi:hypothetical protein
MKQTQAGSVSRPVRCEEGGRKVPAHPPKKPVQACVGASICEHKHGRSECKQCGGARICEHNRIRSTCKQCSGSSSICEHNRIQNRRKQCGESSICEHNRIRSVCNAMLTIWPAWNARDPARQYLWQYLKQYLKRYCQAVSRQPDSICRWMDRYLDIQIYTNLQRKLGTSADFDFAPPSSHRSPPLHPPSRA